MHILCIYYMDEEEGWREILVLIEISGDKGGVFLSECYLRYRFMYTLSFLI